MFFKIKQKLSQIPLSITAVALGLTTIASAWDQFHQGLSGPSFNLPWLKYVTISIAILFLLLAGLKIAFNHRWVYQEMKSGSASSHIPVPFMLLMAIGEFFISLNTTLMHNGNYYFGLVLWYVGLIGQIVYLIWWLITRIIWFDIKDVDGAWYIPWVGIPVACAINPLLLDSGYTSLLQGLWYFSFVGFLLLTILILYRYFFVNPIHTKELPAIGVIAAPASLLLVTYFFDFVLVGQGQAIFMFLLAGLAISFTLIAYISLIKMVTIRFNAGFAAYSFPLAVGALARIVFALWLTLAMNVNPNSNLIHFMTIEGFVELIISSIILLYLLVSFTIHTYLKMSNRQDKILKRFPKLIYFLD